MENDSKSIVDIDIDTITDAKELLIQARLYESRGEFTTAIKLIQRALALTNNDSNNSLSLSDRIAAEYLECQCLFFITDYSTALTKLNIVYQYYHSIAHSSSNHSKQSSIENNNTNPSKSTSAAGINYHPQSQREARRRERRNNNNNNNDSNNSNNSSIKLTHPGLTSWYCMYCNLGYTVDLIAETPRLESARTGELPICLKQQAAVAIKLEQQQQQESNSTDQQSVIKLIERYLYGCILFSILLHYLHNPYDSYNNNNTAINSNNNGDLTFLSSLQLFLSWPPSIRSIARRHYFVLFSYSLMIHKLRIPAYTPTNERRRKAAATSGINSKILNLQYSSHYRPIYLLGESHTISLCWQWLFINNHWYQLVPAFAMGIKAYHFTINLESHESNILKYQFSRLPINSIVLVIAGEIDCRLGEGIHLAVQRNKYSSIQSALIATINNYLTGLLQLANERQLTLLIHPVRPPFLSNVKVKKAVRHVQKKLNQSQQSHNQNNNNNNQTTINDNNNNNNIVTTATATAIATTATPIVSHPRRNARKYYDSTGVNRIEAVHNHALLVRDWNKELYKQINHINSNRIIYINGLYNSLCTGGNEHTIESFSTGNPELYLLQSNYSLEGLHMSATYLYRLEQILNNNNNNIFNNSNNNNNQSQLIPLPPVPIQVQATNTVNTNKSDSDSDSSTSDNELIESLQNLLG